MENVLVLKIIGISEYRGTSRGGKEYILQTLEVEYNGDKVKIKTFGKSANIGDYCQVGISTRKTIYGQEFCVSVDQIIPAKEIEDNWK